MRTPAGLLLTVCLTIAGVPAHGQDQAPSAPAPAITLRDYLDQLERLRVAAERLNDRQPARAADLLATLPHGWVVTASGQRFPVSNEWLRRDLADWRLTPEAALRARMVLRLRAAAADAASFTAPATDGATDRARLERILAAREFGALHGPGWFDSLRYRVVNWFIRMLERVLGSSAIPPVMNFFVYALIAVVVVIVGIWIHRSLQRGAELDTVVLHGQPPAVRPWIAWLEDARRAGAAGRWADAVHFAYWCGVAFLEDQGAWRQDRSRTPREYLGLLPSSHLHRGALQSLTRELERVWYGTEPADASRFDAALAELRKLGCPPL